MNGDERLGRHALERVFGEVVSASEASSELTPDTGMAVAVVAHGAVVYQGVLGLRDRARGLAVTPDTAFEVGSLTKSLTAAALVKLAEDGRIDLHEPLRTKGLVPLAGRAGAEATLADVLSHRTGAPGHDLLWYLGRYTSQELVARQAHLDLLPAGFRGAFAYNNLLYGATQPVFERLFEASWDRVLEHELLGPLGMARTLLDPSASIEDEAMPYVGETLTGRTPIAAVGPAGAARSSIDDMATWALAQLGRRPTVLPEGVLRAMHEPRISTEGINPLLLAGFEWLGAPAYGYGWFVGEAAGEKAVFHMGLCDGFSSAMVLFPDLGHGFVALTNANLTPFPGRFAQRLFEHLTGRETTRQQPEVPPTTPSPSAPPAPDAPPAVEGAYDHPAYGTVEIRRVGGAMHLAWRDHVWPLAFTSSREATFTVTAFGLAIPLPAVFADDRVAIAFALDPRTEPQLFARRR